MSIMERLLKVNEVAYFYPQYDGNGRHLVVSNSSGASLIVNDEILNFLKKLRIAAKPSCYLNGESEKEVKRLYDSQIIIDAEKNGFDILKEAIYYHKHKKKLSITLVTTNKCNMACPYCFEAKNSESMDLVLINKILEYTKDRIDNEKINTLHTVLFGGEPMLNINICRKWLESIYKETKSRGVELIAALVTNGTLITKEFMSYFSQFGTTYAQVTIDGPEKMHNKRRCFKNGMGSYRMILDKLPMVVQAGIRLVLRINVDSENQKFISDMIPDLIDRGLNHKNVVVSLERVISNTENNCAYSHNCISSESYDEEIIPHIINFKLSGFNTGFKIFNPLRPIFCSAYSDKQIAITPNGDICTCLDGIGNDKFTVGNVWNKPVYNERLKDWNEVSTMNFSECRECQVIGFCGGGCGAEALGKYGSFKRGLVCPPLKWSYIGGVALPSELKNRLLAIDFENLKKQRKNLMEG